MKTEDHETLRELLERWFEREDTADNPTAEEFCADHPELLEPFCRIVGRDAAATGLLKGAGRDSSGSSLAEGLELEGYEVIALLGRGGRGEVYLARQAALARFVAVKVLRGEIAGDERARLRFRREAEIAACLDHPNVVPIFGVEERGGVILLIMKWLSGPALDALDAPLSGPEAARIGRDVARALHEAHQLGVIHRDIKPGNLMFDGDQPRILDFGLARSVEEITATLEGMIVGTLPYMSPEQLQSGSSEARLDARTDVYSLGATLYELVAGHPPFGGTDHASLLRNILLTEAAWPRGIDRNLGTIILKALEKERDRRYGTAQEMADDLERYLAGHPIQARRTPLPVRAWMLARRHRRASAAAAGVLLVVLVLLGFLIRGWYRDRLAREGELDRVTRTIQAGNLITARTLIDGFIDRHGAHPAVLRMHSRVQAAESLEDLLDALQLRPEALNPRDLESLVRRIDELGGFADDPERETDWRLARAAVPLLAGRLEEAAAMLRDLPPSLGRTALLSAAQGGEGVAIEAGEVSCGEQELLFVAIALRLTGEPAEVQHAAIRAAEEENLGGYRILFQKLLWMMDHGADDEAIHLGLERLWGERHRPAVLRCLLRQALVLGWTERVRTYRQWLRGFDRQRWTAADAAIFIVASWHLGDRSAVDEELARSAERWKADWHLTMLEARRRAEQGDPTGARQALERARGLTRFEAQKTESRLRLLQSRVEGLRHWGAPLLVEPEPEERRILEELEAEAMALAESADPLIRADALAVASRLALALERPQVAHERLQLALSVAQTPWVLLEPAAAAYSHQLLAQKPGSGSSDPGLQRRTEEKLRALEAVFGHRSEHSTKAREHLRRLRSSAGKGRSPAQPTQILQSWVLDAILSLAAEDYEAALEAARRALDFTEAPLTTEASAYLRWILEAHGDR